MVHFSQEIYLPAEQELPAFVENFVFENWLELVLTDAGSSNKIVGEGYYDVSYFDQTSARRLLQQSGDVKPDDFYDKTFSWAVSKLERTKMHLQVTFSNPSLISTDIYDRMQLEFMAPEKLLIGRGGAAPTELEIKQGITVPRQLD